MGDKNIKRGEHFESCCMNIELPHKKLDHNFAQSHDYVLYGTFISPRPFYVRGITHNDIEMCCCKEHLYARWSVAALIECSEKNAITLEFNNYYSFFSYLKKDCQASPTTYINWEKPNRDQLKHYYSCVNDIRPTLHEIQIDIDF